MNLLQKTLLVAIISFGTMGFASSDTKPSDPILPDPSISANESNQEWMIEGQKRFRTNCGRCHQAPHKFSPRAMAMAVRQMRVRAMLTEDDMKYILYYVTH